MCLALICAGLMAAAPGADPPPPEVQRAYLEERARAGRSPEAQVRLALWCEAHGLTRERLSHLALAVLSDPKNATARGLMGLVSHEGRFVRPEAVAERAQADPVLADYDQRRARAPYTAQGQWAMGAWAEEHGLTDQARAHYTAVVRLDPTREAAWKKLGHRRQGGRWVTEDQVAAEKADAEAQKRADRKWRPLLEKYRNDLKDKGKRAGAEAALGDVADPRASASVARAFGTGRPADQAWAVRLFGQLEGAFASRSLAYLSLSSPSAEVRRSATETLRSRDPREFLGLLIGLIRDPIKFEVRPVGGPGSPGVLFVEGKRANVSRVYAPPPPPFVPLLPGDYVALDDDGLPVVVRTDQQPQTRVSRSGSGVFTADEYEGRTPLSPEREQIRRDALSSPGNSYSELLARQEAANRRMEPELRGGPVTVRSQQTETEVVEVRIPVGRMIAESRRVAASAQQQLAEDVRAIEGENAAIRRSNDRVRSVLKDVIGRDLGDDRAAWDRMWVDRQGYAYRSSSTSPVPTIVEDVPLNDRAAPILPTVAISPVSSSVTATAALPTTSRRALGGFSCFGAGTPVRAIGGLRPIEGLRPGDRVLAQDTRTGSLAYRAILAAYHNPPSATLRIRLGADEVVSTGIHRFWKAGRGWVMARDLKVGDPVRTLGGVARVEAIEDDRVQPVFNLEVAEGHSFLVGKLGALVHDNSLVEPTVAPFDAPAVAAAGP